MMFGRFRREKEATGRICPLCELENPFDASSCSQCYFQLEKNIRQQDEAVSDTEEDVLLDELLNAEMETEVEETFPVDVITMDEMMVEIDQYQVLDSEDEEADAFTFIKSTGPTFSETEVDGDGPAESQSTPTLTSLPGVTVEQNVDYASEVAEEIEVDEAEADVDLLSLPELPQVITPPPIDRDETDFFTPTAEAESRPVGELESVPVGELPSEVSPAVAPEISPEPVYDAVTNMVVEVSVGLPAFPDGVHDVAVDVVTDAVTDAIGEGDGEAGYDSVSVPLPEPSVEVEVELPPLPEVSPDPAAVIPKTSTQAPTTPPPAAAFGNSNNGHIWPWSSAQAWDYRDLYRELKEAMEAGQRGDHTTAATSLDRLGPHLGERVDLLYYVGQVLIILGRREELNSMLSSAQKAHPDDQQVSTAVYHLGVMGKSNAGHSGPIGR